MGGTEAHALGLAEHFTEVIRVAAEPTFDLPLDPASVDCVALRVPVDGVSAAAALGAARRVLREGGCLSFGFDNRSCVGAGRSRRDGTPGGSTLSLRRVRQHAAAAGFRSMHPFYVDPAFVAPATVLPCSRASCGLLELHRPATSRLGPIRRLLARAGLHRLLYPAYLCLAYA